MSEASRTSGGPSGRATAGAILVVLGLALLADRLVPGFRGEIWQLVLGGLFVAGYFYRRAYGLLIPGCILLGLSLGDLTQGSLLELGDSDSIGLGLGFIAIFAIDWLYRGRSHWWPLIPGTILVVTGAAEGSQQIQDWLEVGWPVVLILIGLIVLAGAFRSREEGPA